MTYEQIRMEYDGVEQSRRAARKQVTVDPPFPEARYKFTPDGDSDTFGSSPYHKLSKWVTVEGKEVISWFRGREGFELKSNLPTDG